MRRSALPIVLVPIVLAVMNVVYAFAAYPAGVLSDRFNRLTILIIGFALLMAANLTLVFSDGLLGVTLGVVLWGCIWGFTQGLLATLVADTAPPELRGTAFGVFSLLGGLALLAASVIAGRSLGSVRCAGDIPRRVWIHDSRTDRIGNRAQTRSCPRTVSLTLQR